MAYAKMDVARVLEVLDVDVASGTMTWKPRGSAKFDNKHAGKLAGFHRADGYVQVGIDGRPFYRHRIVMAVANGCDCDMEVDHINGTPGHDQIDNLRYVTRTDQQRNLKMPSSNSSGRIGVSRYRGNRWQAAIWSGNKIIPLGRFDSFHDACAARAKAEIDHGYHVNHGRPS